jgi:hypothetical protein
MSYLRKISISTLLVFQTSNALAAKIDDNFQNCATQALQKRGQTAAVISVNTGGFRERELDHDISNRTSRYRMQVTDKVTGTDLGIVTCTFTRTGDLLAATFDR